MLQNHVCCNRFDFYEFSTRIPLWSPSRPTVILNFVLFFLFVEEYLEHEAAAMSPNPVFSNPLGVHPPYGYNHVSITSPSSQIISIAGQLGNDKDGRPLPSYEQQVAQAFKNLQLCLESVGATPSNVTKIRFYIVDHSDEKMPPLGTSLVKMFGQDPTQYPPSVLVPVPRLATAENFFEIEATAVVERDQATRGGPIEVTNDEFDVLVVGAGLSGLTAAIAVQQAGLSCVVLEAENRVGGKTLCVQAAEGEGVVDLGAAWINDTNQSKMFALAEKYGFHTEVQRVEGLDIAQDEMGKITTTPYGEPKVCKHRFCIKPSRSRYPYT